MFQLVIDKNLMVVTKNDFYRDFFCEGTMYNVHIEVTYLVYILCTCRFKNNLFPVVDTAVCFYKIFILGVCCSATDGILCSTI